LPVTYIHSYTKVQVLRKNSLIIYDFAMAMAWSKRGRRPQANSTQLVSNRKNDMLQLVIELHANNIVERRHLLYKRRINDDESLWY